MVSNFTLERINFELDGIKYATEIDSLLFQLVSLLVNS